MPSSQRTPRPLRTGLWVWRTEDLLSKADGVERLQRVCQDSGFSTIFLHLPYEARQRADRSWRVDWARDRIRALVAALQSVGLQVEALLGTPQLARSTIHGQLLAVVESLISYNRAASTGRFSGLHLDIEPYLLPDFAGDRRERLIGDYLALLHKVRRLTKAAGVTLNVDIPFWFDGICVPTGDRSPSEVRPLNELVTDVADRVTVMAYRTSAEGPNGLVAISQDELRYASSRGRAVTIGLETAELPDAMRGQFTTMGYGRALIIEQLEGGSARITWPLRDVQSQIRGASPSGRPRRVLRQIAKHPISSARISFARLGPTVLAEVIRHASIELKQYPSFAGFAIHDYESVRRWFDD